MRTQNNVTIYGVTINPSLMKVDTVYSIPFGSTYRLIRKSENGKVGTCYSPPSKTPKCGYYIMVK